MSAFESKSTAAPGSFLNDSSIRLTPQQLMSKRYPIHNPDRYAVVAYFSKPEKNKVYVRIFGQYPSIREAEESIREGYAGGYVYFDLCVVDTRSWLPFPPDKFENEKQGSKLLAEILGDHVNRSQSEVTDLKDRVRDSKPSTPFLGYEQHVQAEAKRLIQAMANKESSNSEVYGDLEKRFRKYQTFAQENSDKQFQKEAKEFDMDALTKTHDV